MCPGGYPLLESQNWQSGFLPGVFQGTYIDTKHTDPEKLVEFIHNKTAPGDQRRQLDLLGRLNKMHQESRPNDPQLEARIQSFELAYRMQSEATDAFDVSKEPKHVLDAYGPGEQARSLLLSRRLVERGVRFVQVAHGPVQPWDSHENIDKEHRKLANQCDRAIAALIADLKRLGLFESTLIIWGGEFGRTPVVELPTPGNAKTATGRDHNHWGFTVWLAGGGVKGGQAVGATDEFGFKAVENPVHVHDLHATILHLLGFDHEKFTYRYAGRDFRLTDVHGRVVTEVLA
jgi:arylsulfatase A-like enzyme